MNSWRGGRGTRDEAQRTSSWEANNNRWDQFRFLGKCPPPSPLSKHFTQVRGKCKFWLRGGIGGQFFRTQTLLAVIFLFVDLGGLTLLYRVLNQSQMLTGYVSGLITQGLKSHLVPLTRRACLLKRFSFV